MTRSLNEIETTLRKAALGAGWPLGLAEEAGRAAAWLCARGLDGVGAGLAGIAAGEAAAEARREGRLWRFPAARALSAGPSALDLLAAEGRGARVALEALDAPLLLVGLAGVAAAAHGGGFALRTGETERAVIGAAAARFSDPPLAPGETLTLEARDAALPAAAGPATRPEPDPALWAEAEALADRLLVPASETSRARGAGAGLIDDD